MRIGLRTDMKKIRLISILVCLLLMIGAFAAGCKSENNNQSKDVEVKADTEVESGDSSEVPLEIETESIPVTETGAKADTETEQQAVLNADTLENVDETVYASDQVNIRTAPSTDAAVYKVASSGASFHRTQNDGNWSAVEIDGTGYYIASAYLTTEEPAAEASAAPSGITQTQNAGTGIVYASSNGHSICIDPGHQSQGDSTPEQVAPGSSETKARVTGGTTGTTTGITEYELNLEVGLKLRDELIARGYGVVMTRETNDVNLSNSERASIAANAGCDAFVRIHANGSENSSTNGAMTICPTASNPYVASLYSQSKSLSQDILDNFCATTGANKEYVWETDSMSGINWSTVPVTILEMGYMTNPTEDTNMASETYQNQMVQGIANGIDTYFQNN